MVISSKKLQALKPLCNSNSGSIFQKEKKKREEALMAGSTILSRLSPSRLKALPVKLKSSKPVLPTISPLKSSSQSQFSSASSSSSVKRISGISRNGNFPFI
uniref:Uncharacterized protein n=1 Tax=Gossypium raimondii TaxID=29730 RepID=A0A0D2U371_GOSRA|nr:hypothetical protein B456_010G108700 [Gossypium raimondii]